MNGPLATICVNAAAEILITVVACSGCIAGPWLAFRSPGLGLFRRWSTLFLTVISGYLSTSDIPVILRRSQSRFRKSEQGDKWSFCLTAGKIGPRIRRDDEQTTTPEPHTGLQGEGGACCRQGRPDDRATG